MRCFVLAAVLPLAACAVGQDTSVKVTYTTRAARAERVIRELGAMAKVDLDVSPQTQGEILAISVKDVPLSALMDRIAKVTSGEWKQEGAKYRLIASASMRKQEEREYIAKRVAQIRKAIDERQQNDNRNEAMATKAAAEQASKAKTAAKKSDAKAKQKSDDEQMQDMQAAMAAMPVAPEELAITALLRGLDPSVIAQIEGGDRMVFSTDPTKTQRSLGPNASEIINAFIQKHDAQTPEHQPDMSEQFAGLTDEQRAMMQRVMRQAPRGKIGQAAKALLILSDNNQMFGMSGDNIEIEFRVYDAKGKVLFSDRSSLDTSNGQRMMTAPADSADLVATETTKPKNPTTQTKSTPIEYSEETKAIQNSMKGMETGNFNVRLPQELKQKMLLPSQYDPLSFVETDEAMFYAKSLGKPLVADLPDVSSLRMELFGGSKTNRTLEEYQQELKDGTSIAAIPDGEFAVLKPASPVRSRADRVDRLALTTLMQAAHDKGVVSLDDLASYAAVSPSPYKGGIGQGYLFLFAPGCISMDMIAGDPWEMLRFYAQLGPETRAHLRSGGKLLVSSLSAGERIALERMTYGAGAKLSVEDPANKQPADDLPGWMTAAFDNLSGASDYRGEPTEAIPNGLPGDGYLDLKGASEPFVAPVPGPDSSIMAFFGVLGLDELAMFKMMRSQAGGEAFSSMFPKFPKLRGGERSVMDFTFHLAPQVSVKQKLMDHKLGSGDIFSEDNLPAAMQKRVAERMEVLKKSPMGAMGSFMGNQAIHP